MLIYLCLLGLPVFAQIGFEVKSYFEISGANVTPKVDLNGRSSVYMNNIKKFGLLFSNGFGANFRINSGLNYSYSIAKHPLFFCLNDQKCNRIAIETKFKMISIPVYAEYGLGRYLYAAAGPVIDFQLSEGNSFSDQSGIGYLVGLGGKVTTDKLLFTVFPNYKRHSVIPFEKQRGVKDILQEFGVQFGVGCKF